ncbi:MAG: NYN domain-containing protein, partial [Paracoccaceae bacterium]
RKACSSFVEIGHKALAQKPATAPRPNIEPQDNTINQWLAQLISQNDEPNGMEISRIGGTMHTLHKVKISERPEKNWRAYLERQNKFQCDPRGAGARVRIK